MINNNDNNNICMLCYLSIYVLFLSVLFIRGDQMTVNIYTHIRVYLLEREGCVYMYVCMYLCVYIWICIYTYKYLYECMYVYAQYMYIYDVANLYVMVFCVFRVWVCVHINNIYVCCVFYVCCVLFWVTQLSKVLQINVQAASHSMNNLERTTHKIFTMQI